MIFIQGVYQPEDIFPEVEASQGVYNSSKASHHKWPRSNWVALSTVTYDSITINSLLSIFKRGLLMFILRMADSCIPDSFNQWIEIAWPYFNWYLDNNWTHFKLDWVVFDSIKFTFWFHGLLGSIEYSVVVWSMWELVLVSYSLPLWNLGMVAFVTFTTPKSSPQR